MQRLFPPWHPTADASQPFSRRRMPLRVIAMTILSGTISLGSIVILGLWISIDLREP